MLCGDVSAFSLRGFISIALASQYSYNITFSNVKIQWMVVDHTQMYPRKLVSELPKVHKQGRGSFQHWEAHLKLGGALGVFPKENCSFRLHFQHFGE